MKVKTSELSGRALDWAVALSTGQYEITRVPKDIDGENSGCLLAPTGLVDSGFRWPTRGKVGPLYFIKKYSTDWSLCGPLAEALKISCYCSIDPENETAYHWCGVKEVVDYRKRRGFTGETPMVAICRAVVAAKLGYEVDIPDELMEVGE